MASNLTTAQAIAIEIALIFLALAFAVVVLLTGNRGRKPPSEKLTARHPFTCEPPAKTVSFAYDLDGNRAGLTYPGEIVAGYGYTARNQMSGVTLNPTLITPDSFWGKQGASMPRIS